jgi:hypothetical protein
MMKNSDFVISTLTCVGLISLLGLNSVQAQETRAILQEQGALDQSAEILSSDGSRYQSHYFQGNAGQTVTITLQSSDLDTYLIVLDPQGRKIGENDDANQNTRDSQIQLTLPATGRYQAIANAYDASGQGNYLITVSGTGGIIGEAPSAVAQSSVQSSVTPVAASPPRSGSSSANVADIARMAQDITVLIESQNSGSGVILTQDGNTYYVVTAAHVVQYEDWPYTIVTSDQQRYTLNYQTVQKLPGVDLAILQFQSDRAYRVARIANSDQATVGTPTFIGGFPDLSESIR